jgi:hypothetical protein
LLHLPDSETINNTIRQSLSKIITTLLVVVAITIVIGTWYITFNLGWGFALIFIMNGAACLSLCLVSKFKNEAKDQSIAVQTPEKKDQL